MNQILGPMETILDAHISGFHQYVLDVPPRLTFVSRSCCDMLGCACQDLLEDPRDGYAARVHPDDRALFENFLCRLRTQEQTLQMRYRLIRSDGAVLYVIDRSTARRLSDGRMAADSMLTDITEVLNENRNLHFLDQTVSCGFLCYTCAPEPAVTYVNDQMLRILRIPPETGGQSQAFAFYRNNILRLIPGEERPHFLDLLRRVQEGEGPVTGELTVLRGDGTRARLYGWITKNTAACGETEIQSVCVDVTERFETERARRIDRYMQALTEVYDKIFEYDFAADTVKCLYGKNSEVFKWVQDIPMQLAEATEKWIRKTVVEADRDRVLAFFQHFYRPENRGEGTVPVQIRYNAFSSDGTVRAYAGVFLQIDTQTSFFCCRRAVSDPTAGLLAEETAALRGLQETLPEMVLRMTDGIVAFEVENDMVRPLYISENICDFFGYTKNEWISMTRHRQSIRSFVSHSNVRYEEFTALFQNGEAEFEYMDRRTQCSRWVKAVCSHGFSGVSGKQYVMLYDITERKEAQAAAAAPKVYIRTFGYFDVFVDGRPIVFRNEKARELLALLTDRRGGYVSSEEAIGFLWEEETANPVTLARYRKVALRLKNTLEEYGVSDILESVSGKRRLMTDRVRCDLYDYLSGAPEHAQLFKGSYLSNYSWGEITLSGLMDLHPGLEENT
ncbi:MAG: PAS domain-containing protein [Butyricicoccaceae bacterium]